MTVGTECSSGIVGLAGRDEHLEPAVRSAEFHVAGAVLPVVSPARVYVCGITPYDVTHLGHAATFVWADAVEAVLRSVGVHTVVVPQRHGRRRRADLGRGRARPALRRLCGVPGVPVRAGHGGVAGGAARAHAAGTASHPAGTATGGGVARHRERLRTGRVGVLPRHGAVAASGLSRDRALALAREFGDNPDDPMREDPFDVPVWRPSTARDPAWPSPWGWGRPGWHAECAAMAMAAFGASVDLLIGGQDLTFPHHAYQSAMVQAATSVAPFARRACMSAPCTTRAGRWRNRPETSCWSAICCAATRRPRSGCCC